jgi:hypothetical protein
MKHLLRFFPIAVRPKDAAAMLGISESLLEELVRDRKLRPPVKVPGHRVSLFGYRQLVEDWEAMSQRAEEANPWDA